MRILFVGGGTLGSVTPLLAVGEALRARVPGVEFRWWGTRNGPERAVIAAAGIPFQSLPSGKLRRYWDVRNILDVVVIAYATGVAFVRFLRQRPSVVVGAGSFVQVPVAWAAWVLRIPVVIHQQDARAGLANRLAAPVATRITAVFPACAHAFGRRTVAVIGNPVRRAILDARALDPHDAKRRFGFSGDRPVLLIIGGGTGARALNELVRAALPSLSAHADVIHVTGKGKGEMTNDERRMTKYRSFELLTNDLPYAYAAADLVVARAGMGTITECMAIGKPTAFVPMPGTHQEENAAQVAAAGAGVVWDERALTATIFTARVRELLHDADHHQAREEGLCPTLAQVRMGVAQGAKPPVKAPMRALAAGCAALAVSGAADRLAAVIVEAVERRSI